MSIHRKAMVVILSIVFVGEEFKKTINRCYN